MKKKHYGSDFEHVINRPDLSDNVRQAVREVAWLLEALLAR